MDVDVIFDLAELVTSGIIVGGFYFAYKHWKADERQSQALSNERMTQIVLQLAERWESEGMRKSRQKVNENVGTLKQVIEQADKDNNGDLYDLVAIGNYFDLVGMLVMEGCLSITVAYNLFNEQLKYYLINALTIN